MNVLSHPVVEIENLLLTTTTLRVKLSHFIRQLTHSMMMMMMIGHVMVEDELGQLPDEVKL